MFAQAADVGEELVAATGRVGPDEDRAAVAVRVGKLVQGLVQDGDVVGGGVAAGVTRTQHPGQGFTGGVEETQQRVVAEGVFPGRRRRFLLRMRRHDCRVDVQHEPGQRLAEHHGGGQRAPGLEDLRPGQFPGGGARRPQPGQGRGVDRIQDPPRGRIRGHRTERAALLPQHRQIDDGFAAVSHEHRQVDRDAAWFVRWPALPVQAQCLDEAAGQPGLVSQIGVSRRAPATRSCQELLTVASDSLGTKSASDERGNSCVGGVDGCQCNAVRESAARAVEILGGRHGAGDGAPGRRRGRRGTRRGWTPGRTWYRRRVELKHLADGCRTDTTPHKHLKRD